MNLIACLILKKKIRRLLDFILVHATGQQKEEDVKSLESLMRDEREKAITCVFCHDLH